LPEAASWDRTHAAILMDIRDELKAMNRRLNCQEFLLIPSYLRTVIANTTRRPRRRRKK
jgi:hypothetical protein